jgi:hypothetical protein
MLFFHIIFIFCKIKKIEDSIDSTNAYMKTANFSLKENTRMKNKKMDLFIVLLQMIFPKIIYPNVSFSALKIA